MKRPSAYREWLDQIGIRVPESGSPNKALQPTAAAVCGLPGPQVSEAAAAAELGR